LTGVFDENITVGISEKAVKRRKYVEKIWREH
jgi:hypothetical protein